MNHVAALLVAILFLSTGIWKIISPFAISRMFEQLLVPYRLSMWLVLTLAVFETLAGFLVLIPRSRRVGAWLATLLLFSFMLYIGYNYSALIGRDCSCFPWVKRAVGPALFPEDGAMMAAALLAGWWAKPIQRLRSVVIVCLVITFFTAAGYQAAAAHLSGTQAPKSILADGKPFSLQHGRVFLYFYDPTCSHCDAAARHMATYKWKNDVVRIAVPVTLVQFAPAFLRDTHFDAKTSGDLEILKKVFPFGDPPYGVALENGRELGPVAHFDDGENGAQPRESLKAFGFIE